MAALLLLATILNFVNGAKVNDTNIVFQHPILDLKDPVLTTNDSDQMLGVCYGSNALWSQYPYVVQLIGSCSCSGSIIDMGSGSRPATILTAAHCQNCAQTVYVGCNSPGGCSGGAYPVQSGSFQTWGYQNPSQFSNDIAIVKLQTALSSNTGPFLQYLYENKIHLNSYWIYSGARAVQIASNTNGNSNTNRITGYGIDETRSTPNQLQTASTNYVSPNACQSALGGNGVTIESNMICVQGSGNPGPTVCSGDSGGPWVGGNGIQYGVTSFGLAALVGGCSPYECRCCPQYPQVGANVGFFNSQLCSAIGGNNAGC